MRARARSHRDPGLTRAFSLGLARKFREAERTASSAVRTKPNKYISLEGVGQLRTGAAGALRDGGSFRFVDGFFDFDRTVGNEGTQRADRGGDRCDDGTDDSRRQRKFGNRLALLLHDHAANVSFLDQLSKL